MFIEEDQDVTSNSNIKNLAWFLRGIEPIDLVFPPDINALQFFSFHCCLYFLCYYRDVPLSLFIGIMFVFIAYIGTTSSLTLMVPYQNISVTSPFPSAYIYRGWNWAQYLVSIGALAAMTAALFSALLVVPRYLYAMARDGLLLIQIGEVNEKTGVSNYTLFYITYWFNKQFYSHYLCLKILLQCSL